MNVKDTLSSIKRALSFTPKNRLQPRWEYPNIARSAVASSIQSACSASENGNPRQLFQLYRDMVASGSHLQNEVNKRKLSVLGDTLTITPADKSKAEDKLAAEAVKRMIDDCENWLDGLMFLMDSAAIHPVSLAEMIWRPVDKAGLDAGSPIPAFTLRKLSPVNYGLLSFLPLPLGQEPPADQWECDIRILSQDDVGRPQNIITSSTCPDPNRHIVHRGHMMVGVPDKWGGPGRAVLAWWFLAQMARDWFGRYMERFGTPFPVGKTNVNDAQAVTMLQEAFSTASKIGGLVVSSSTEIELKEAAINGGAQAYDTFLGVCNREISKVLVGQEMSSSTGAGSSGVAKIQKQVRDDIRIWDQKKLCDTLTKQLVRRFLYINGFKGSPPKLNWGTLSVEESAGLGVLLVQLSTSGLQPTDEALPIISERVGFDVERKDPLVPVSTSHGQLPDGSSPDRKHNVESKGQPTGQAKAATEGDPTRDQTKTF